MLVILDLDDTLIETSKCLTPHYVSQAFFAMQKAGLVKEARFEQLSVLNEKALCLRHAIQEFCKHFSLGPSICEAGLSTLHQKWPENIFLEPVPGALEMLEELQVNHTLALVTLGDPLLQQEKLKKAGIQPERFSKLVIGKGPSKKFDYQTVIEDLGFLPEDVLVCGDRVSVDLSPGKELGFYTVHFRNGRGMVHDQPKADVDFTIDTLKQLHEVT